MIKELSNTEIIRMIGRRLRQYRINLNLTQKELAEKTNISVPTIQKFESGNSYNITFGNLLTIIRHLGLLDNIEKFIPEQPESPYAKRRNQQRIRHATEKN